MNQQPLCLTIDPFSVRQYREELPQLEQRFSNFWAGITYDARLISCTRRFSFAPIRQRLRQQTSPLDDLRDLLPMLVSAQDGAGDGAALTSLVQKRLATYERATAALQDAPAVHAAFRAMATGASDATTLAVVADGCRRALWPWRWLKNYRRAYEVMEREGNPLGIQHYFVAWPSEYTDAEAVRSVLKGTFLLPDVQIAPLPPLFHGKYREMATYLAPLDEGRPYLRVIHAFDVRGDWDLGSMQELLGGEEEVAVALDVTTLPRAKAQRATTDAFNVLEGALTARNAVKDARSERAYRDVSYAMNQLDVQQLHEVAYAILVQAPSVRDLNRITQTLRDRMGARLKLDVLSGTQGEYLKLFTTTPSKQIAAPLIRRNALSEHVAAKTPWGIRKSDRTTGTLWGFDPHDQLPFHYDLFGRTGTDNPHLLMLGKAGSGKTVTLGALALRQAVAGHQVIMFDPVGKCEWLCEAVGGGATYYHLANEVAINILDPLSTSLNRQKSHVERKLSMILGRSIHHGTGVQLHPRLLTNAERGALEAALASTRIYGPDGVFLAQMDDETAPLLSDLVVALRETNRPTGHALAEEISDIALQSQAHLFDRQTTLKWDFGSDVVAYNLNNADKALLPMYLDHGFAALNHYVRSPERRARNQKLVCVIDEFGVMSQIESLKAEVAYDTKEWRNYGAAMWSADQNASTYMGGSGNAQDFSNQTTNNTAVKLFGRQEGTDANLLAEAYPELSPSDIAAIRTAGPGEFVGIFGTNEVHHLRVQLTDQETPYFIRKG